MSEELSHLEVQWMKKLKVGRSEFSVELIIEALEKMVTPERLTRINEIVNYRSRRVVTVLENIYDRGNVSAAMRSAEAFGFLDFRVIEYPGAKFKAANRVTRGCEKWMDIKKYSTTASCIRDLKSNGYKILATHLDTDTSLFDLDWSRPTAFVMGNEKDGVSEELLSLADEKVKIPMWGFSQSFNISVATAILLSHARKEIESNGGGDFLLNAAEKPQLFANYLIRCFDSPEKLVKQTQLGIN